MATYFAMLEILLKAGMCVLAPVQMVGPVQTHTFVCTTIESYPAKAGKLPYGRGIKPMRPDLLNKG